LYGSGQTGRAREFVYLNFGRNKTPGTFAKHTGRFLMVVERLVIPKVFNIEFLLSLELRPQALEDLDGLAGIKLEKLIFYTWPGVSYSKKPRPVVMYFNVFHLINYSKSFDIKNICLYLCPWSLDWRVRP